MKNTKIIQITDTHIFTDNADSFDSVNTTESLNRVLSLIKDSDVKPDLIIASGDLVHDASPSAYRKLDAVLQKTEAPVYCLPGNHDDPDMMQKYLNKGNVHTRKSFQTGRWNIIFLDSVIPGSHGGKLSDEELSRLKGIIDEHKTCNHLICLHHHPVLIGSAWMDGMMLENAESLFSLTDNMKQIKIILWGHIHQEFDSKRKGVRLLGAPSTCVQFKPGTDTYVQDDKAPGFRVIELYENGDFETEIRRLGD